MTEKRGAEEHHQKLSSHFYITEYFFNSNFVIEIDSYTHNIYTKMIRELSSVWRTKWVVRNFLISFQISEIKQGDKF
jgi:hypothetical protein